MAGVNELNDATYTVNQALGINKYYAVMQDSASDMKVKLPTGVNVNLLGIARETRAHDKAIAIVKGGRTYVIVDGAVAAKDYLYSNGSDGKLTKVPTNATPQHYNAIGQAEEDASADGDVIIAEIFQITLYQ